jgi:hypothetical protein
MGASKFLSKNIWPLSQNYHQAQASSRTKISKPTSDKSTKKKNLGTVEYQRKKRNTIWNLNDQTTGETRNHGWKN